MGGTILANNLARRLTPELKSGKVKITMLTASAKHMYQPGLLYFAFGRVTPDELYKDQASLLEPSIALFVDPAEEFLLDENRVKSKSGKTFDYDVLVIATGSRPVPELIPGLAEHGQSFYTEETAIKMSRATGVPGRARRDCDGGAAQVPDGAARDHVHAARLLQGSRHSGQGAVALHLPDRSRPLA